jgi:hypothetical protein
MGSIIYLAPGAHHQHAMERLDDAGVAREGAADLSGTQELLLEID